MDVASETDQQLINGAYTIHYTCKRVQRFITLFGFFAFTDNLMQS